MISWFIGFCLTKTKILLNFKIFILYLHSNERKILRFKFLMLNQKPMHNKMILGIIFLIIGIASVILGIVFITNKKSKNINTLRENQFNKRNDITKEKIFSDNSNKEMLENLITIATTDGQFTNNEEKHIREKAKELGLNYDEYSSKIKELLESKKYIKETSIIDKNKEKGDNFEKFVVQKFSKKYFKIDEWAGDKYINGNYAETTIQPDLKINFKKKNVSIDFAVECKYRSDYYKNGVEWCSKQQLIRYKKFSIEKNINVFIVIGIAGLASEPAYMFIVPLNKINSCFLSKDFLKKYQKLDFKDHNFYFDFNSNELK